MSILGSEAPDIEAEEWINAEPEDTGEGVFLIDFWSYTCPDCSGRAEELSKLHEKTSVEVLGIHAPEFGFEHENVEEAVKKRGIEYPVAKDDEKSVWKSFGNRERPRQVIVKDGEVVWKNAGESRSLEEALEELLGLEDTPELKLETGHSPMLKTGYENCRGINEKGNFKGEEDLEMPSTRKMNRIYLSGIWKQEEDYIEAVEDAVLRLKFRASTVEAVIRSGEGVTEVRLDSQMPGERAGEDVQEGSLEIDHPDVYSVVEAEEEMQSELSLRVASGTRIYGISLR